MRKSIIALVLTVSIILPLTGVVQAEEITINEEFVGEDIQIKKVEVCDDLELFAQLPDCTQSIGVTLGTCHFCHLFVEID